MMPQICNLQGMPNPAVYRRKDGSVYLKLNEKCHVKTKHDSERQTWKGDGLAEEFNPTEEVEVVDQ